MSAELAYGLGVPGAGGRIRGEPEDFRVVEDLGFEPAGSGEHVFLRVRKRAVNTEWVARRLAAFSGVSLGAVSYAGLKDRHAVAEQWFSVHLPGRHEPDWAACGDDGFRVLEHSRHIRKLRRGVHRGNSFRIVVRDLQGDLENLGGRLKRIAEQGVPNYFGAQRFGRDAENLVRAEAMFQDRERVRNRHKRSLYLSAARAFLFNQILSRRVAAGTWNRPLVGDVMMLEGTRSIFTVQAVDETIHERTLAMDIHPTGPLWGRGQLLSQDTVRMLEQALVEDFSILCRGLEKAGLEQQRRALRVRVSAAALEASDPHNPVIRFRLPAGAYATAVLREILDFSEQMPRELYR